MIKQNMNSNIIYKSDPFQLKNDNITIDIDSTNFVTIFADSHFACIDIPVIFIATDPDSSSGHDTTNITIEQINDPPFVQNSINDTTLSEDFEELSLINLITVFDDHDLQYGDFTRVVQIDFGIFGQFADAANTTLLATDENTYFRWGMCTSYLVQISHIVKTDDTGANGPQVNIDVNGANPVSTSNSNAGREVDTSWVATTTDINTSNYSIAYSNSIEVRTDANGSNNDARDLTISCVFVKG